MVKPIQNPINKLFLDRNEIAAPIDGQHSSHEVQRGNDVVNVVFRHCIICGKDCYPSNWNSNGVITPSSRLWTCDSEDCSKKMTAAALDRRYVLVGTRIRMMLNELFADKNSWVNKR